MNLEKDSGGRKTKFASLINNIFICIVSPKTKKELGIIGNGLVVGDKSKIKFFYFTETEHVSLIQYSQNKYSNEAFVDAITTMQYPLTSNELVLVEFVKRYIKILNDAPKDSMYFSSKQILMLERLIKDVTEYFPEILLLYELQ